MASQQQFDVITRLKEHGVDHIAREIFSYLDADSLDSASRVSRDWRDIIREGCLWKKLIEKNVASDPVWADIVKRRGLSSTTELDDTLHENIYHKIVADLRDLETRWQTGRCAARRLSFEQILEVDVVQCDDETVIIGSFFEGIKIFDSEAETCKKTFQGQVCGAACIQFDDRMIMCGSYDGAIRVWDRNDPDGSEPCSILPGHLHRVNDLKFNSNSMVSCSHDQPHVIVWDVISPRDIRFRKGLDWAGAEWICNVDLDDRFVVSGSEDGTIKVWDKQTLDCVKTLHGSGSLDCCQYRDGLVVGAFETKIEVWDAESGICLRSIDADAPKLVRFDRRRLLVSERHNFSRIRVWDLKSVLDKDVPSEALNCATLNLPCGFCAQDMRFDEFHIKCWSCQCIMFIWDFRDPAPG